MTHEMSVTMLTPGVYHSICPDCGRHIVTRDVEGEDFSRTVKVDGDNSVGHSGNMGPVSVGVRTVQPGALDDVCNKLFGCDE